MRPSHALGRHLALAGFMGAGKSSLGREVAERLGRVFVDLDHEVESRAGRSIAELFDEQGEAAFRALEEQAAADTLRGAEPVVVALGGGAVLPESTRRELARRAFTVVLDVEAEDAWHRTSGSDRPLARDEAAFQTLYRTRAPLYDEVADARADDLEELLLAAAGAHV
ncbi:MAG: shikimate kinase, partial [Actinobacteria bacterium]|nr:shikimate kinase [Actinomycetota bacterium]